MTIAEPATRNVSTPVEMLRPSEHHRRIWDQRDGAHRGEVMRDDGDRQQRGGGERTANAAAKTGETRRNDQCGRAEQAAEHDGGGDDVERPDDSRRQLQRHHARVMHGRDADADHCAAGGGKQAARARDRKAEPDAGNENGEDQRKDRHADGISGARTRIIGKHRDEMRGPDAATADHSIEHDPVARVRPCEALARSNRLMATALARKQTSPASATRRRSCSVLRQAITRYISGPKPFSGYPSPGTGSLELMRGTSLLRW